MPQFAGTDAPNRAFVFKAERAPENRTIPGQLALRSIDPDYHQDHWRIDNFLAPPSLGERLYDWPGFPWPKARPKPNQKIAPRELAKLKKVDPANIFAYGARHDSSGRLRTSALYVHELESGNDPEVDFALWHLHTWSFVDGVDPAARLKKGRRAFKGVRGMQNERREEYLNARIKALVSMSKWSWIEVWCHPALLLDRPRRELSGDI